MSEPTNASPEGVRRVRVFDATEEAVVEGAGCTWCAVGVAESCRRRVWGGWEPERTHAQRWRDYWNATHDPAEQTDVYPNPAWMSS